MSDTVLIVATTTLYPHPYDQYIYNNQFFCLQYIVFMLGLAIYTTNALFTLTPIT